MNQNWDLLFNKLKKNFDEKKHVFKKQSVKRGKIITEYEETVHFSAENRQGSKVFRKQLDVVIQHVFEASPKFQKIKNPFELHTLTETHGIQYKSAYNTTNKKMTQKIAEEQIRSVLKQGKNFIFLVLTDKDNQDRNVPLHLGYGMEEVENFLGYDKEKSRWISGNKVWEYLFGANANGKKAKVLFLSMLKNIDYVQG